MNTDKLLNNMKKESLLKFYVGNKSIGSHSPVLVVAGDNTWKNRHFGEHYIFADVKQLPFVFRRDVVGLENANPELVNFDAYPQIFSAESLLANQFIAARAHFEFAFSTLDMNAYKEVFWEGRMFEFLECDDSHLVRFHLLRKYTREMDVMFRFSQSKKLQELKEAVSRLPRIKIEEDSGDHEKQILSE